MGRKVNDKVWVRYGEADYPGEIVYVDPPKSFFESFCYRVKLEDGSYSFVNEVDVQSRDI